jgi:hypothetical protein
LVAIGLSLNIWCRCRSSFADFAHPAFLLLHRFVGRSAYVGDAQGATKRRQLHFLEPLENASTPDGGDCELPRIRDMKSQSVAGLNPEPFVNPGWKGDLPFGRQRGLSIVGHGTIPFTCALAS